MAQENGRSGFRFYFVYFLKFIHFLCFSWLNLFNLFILLVPLEVHTSVSKTTIDRVNLIVRLYKYIWLFLRLQLITPFNFFVYNFAKTVLVIKRTFGLVIIRVRMVKAEIVVGNKYIIILNLMFFQAIIRFDWFWWVIMHNIVPYWTIQIVFSGIMWINLWIYRHTKLIELYLQLFRRQRQARIVIFLLRKIRVLNNILNFDFFLILLNINL